MISTQQNDIKKKEIELESKRQKLAEDQALLMAREQSLVQGESQLEQKKELLNEVSELIRTQSQLLSEQVLRLETLNQQLEMNTSSPEEKFNSPNQEDFEFLLDHHQQLISQQKDLLASVQLTGERLDQDKNWIKSLLKGLLDQQEKFQHLEDRMREREKDSMIRKEADLQHERGWIKVEKAKLRKSEIQESKREQPVSESIF